MTEPLNFNLRQTMQDRQVDYLAALRDSSLFDLYGLPAELHIPKEENNVDEYINYKDEDFDKQHVIIVPKFKEYRQILSQHGMTAEEDIDYPLEIAVPSALHVPRNTRVLLSEYDANENKVGREWRVLSSTTKQLSNSKSYTKLLFCVPARTNIMVTSAVDEIKCVSYVEPLEEESVIIHSNSQAVNVSAYAYVTVDGSTIREHTVKVQDIICNAVVRVLSPSIFYN